MTALLTTDAFWREESEVQITPPPHVAAVRDRAVDAFIDDLRSFVLDRSLSATLEGRETNGDDLLGSLSNDPAGLRAWHGWSTDGRAFLDSMGDHEPIDHALAPYKQLVVEFVGWVSKWQAAMHRGALEELADLQRGHRGAAPKATTAADDEATVPESWLSSRRFVRAS